MKGINSLFVILTLIIGCNPSDRLQINDIDLPQSSVLPYQAFEPTPTPHPSSVQEYQVLGCWGNSELENTTLICFEYKSSIDNKIVYSFQSINFLGFTPDYQGDFIITKGESGGDYNQLIISPTSESVKKNNHPGLCSRIDFKNNTDSKKTLNQIVLTEFQKDNSDGKCLNYLKPGPSPKVWNLRLKTAKSYLPSDFADLNKNKPNPF